MLKESKNMFKYSQNVAKVKNFNIKFNKVYKQKCLYTMFINNDPDQVEK